MMSSFRARNWVTQPCWDFLVTGIQGLVQNRVQAPWLIDNVVQAVMSKAYTLCVVNDCA